MQQLSTPEFKTRIKHLIGENLVKQAFEELLAELNGKDTRLYHRAIQQKSRYNFNENQLRDGLIPASEGAMVYNRINVAILDILEEYELPLPSPTNYHKTNTRNLLNRIPNSNSLFVGREKELAQFQDAFDRYNFFVIEGVGGIGKTEFTIECIRRFVEDKDRILWVSPLMKFDVMVHQAGYGEMLKIEQLNDFQKFKNFEGLLDRDNRILFLEDFHDNTDDNYTRFFEQFSLRNAKVIVISRFMPPGLDPGTVIKLKGLGQDAFHFAQDERNKKSQYEDITDEDLQKLIEAVEGHPLSIELGVQLLSYGEPADDIVKVFTNEEYQGIKKISDLSQRLLFEVLKNDKTSQAERDLLFRFSVFRDKVPFEAIASLYDKARIKYPLSQLIEKSLIRYKSKLYDCAPLIREFCLPRLEGATDIHRRAADYFLQQRSDTFDPALEEDIIHHLQGSEQWEVLGAHVEQHGKAFIKLGQVNLLNDTIDALKKNGIEGPVFLVYKAEIYIHLSEFTKAREFINAALAIYEKNEDKRGQSIALNVLGRVKWTTNLTDALASLEESYRLAEELGEQGLMVASLNLIANNYFEAGNLDKALENAELSKKIAEEFKDQFNVGKALNVLGRISSFRSNYENALELLKNSFGIFEKMNHKVMMVVTLNNISSVFFRLRRYQESITEFCKCLEVTNSIGSRLETAKVLINLGYNYIELNKTNEALEKLNIGLTIYEEINYKQGKASALNALGLAYSKQNNFKSALENYYKSIEICEEIGYKIGLIYLYESLGKLYFYNIGKYDQSCYFILKSIGYRKQMGVNSTNSENLFFELQSKFGNNKDFEDLICQTLKEIPEKIVENLNELLDKVGKNEEKMVVS